MRVGTLRCDAMAMDVTLIGRAGMDLGWINWDMGLDLVIGRGRMGRMAMAMRSVLGWDGMGDGGGGGDGDGGGGGGGDGDGDGDGDDVMRCDAMPCWWWRWRWRW